LLPICYMESSQPLNMFVNGTLSYILMEKFCNADVLCS